METEQKLSAGRYESSILDSNGFEVITVNEIAILDNYRERLGVDHWAISPKASRGLADSEIRDLRDKVVLSVNSHDGMLRALKHAIFSDHFHDPDCCEECKKTESLLTQIAAAEGRNG